MAGSRDGATPPTAEQREDAVRILDAALADGQLTMAEHQERLTAVLSTDDERRVGRTLLDLQVSSTAPLARPGLSARLRSWPGRLGRELRADGAKVARAWRSASPRAQRVIVIGSLLFTTGTAVAVVEAREDSLERIERSVRVTDPTEAIEGLERFRDLYEEEFGTTLAGGVQLDVGGDYAEMMIQVEAPLEGEEQRYQRWQLTGDRFSEASTRSSGEPAVDLAELDPAMMDRDLESAWLRLDVEDPVRVTIIIRATDERPTVTYIVSNDYRESGQLTTDLDGTWLRRRPFVEPGTGPTG